MEQRLTQSADRSRAGFVLVTVIVLTAVGLLFGAGALLMFKFQCQLRIDRQHELEKVYAVRSALNYIRTRRDIPDEGKTFGYHNTASDRELGVIVKPVEPIFPKDINAHFFMTNSSASGGFEIPCANQYNGTRDYEYGVSGATNGYVMTESIMDSEFLPRADLRYYALAFKDTASTNLTWWINIGMRGTGAWLQEEYGRRYYFYLNEYVGSANTGASGDITRLCIIRDVLSGQDKDGYRHGWPLSQNGERALVLEIRPSKDGTDVAFLEYSYEAGGLNKVALRNWRFLDAKCYIGMQLAQRRVSIFYIKTSGGGSQRTLPYTFAGSNDEDMSVDMSQDAYDYFARPVSLGGTTYEGVATNSMGRVLSSPELRAVIEVEAASELRNGLPRNNGDHQVLTDFRATPAYQYDIFLSHPAAEAVNLATVAQNVQVGAYKKNQTSNAVRTYDTHGTANKGFRTDERRRVSR